MKKLLAILLVMLTSCTISYKFNGASINYNLIKTISVSDFPIRAALVYPPLEEVFSNKLKDAYTRQTRLQMVDTNGDLQVSGEITGYNLTPQAVGTDAYATMTRLTISVKVTFINTKDPQFDFENRTFSAYQDFSSDRMLTDVQDELIDVITEELVELIFNATVANW
ncbi:MAG: LptE family protein [Bacteroidaceae bacterium]|nr:LptE family protein [Bacteroidaceae bacterium]